MKKFIITQCGLVFLFCSLASSWAKKTEITNILNSMAKEMQEDKEKAREEVIKIFGSMKSKLTKKEEEIESFKLEKARLLKSLNLEKDLQQQKEKQYDTLLNNYQECVKKMKDADGNEKSVKNMMTDLKAQNTVLSDQIAKVKTEKDFYEKLAEKQKQDCTDTQEERKHLKAEIEELKKTMAAQNTQWGNEKKVLETKSSIVEGIKEKAIELYHSKMSEIASLPTSLNSSKGGENKGMIPKLIEATVRNLPFFLSFLPR